MSLFKKIISYEYLRKEHLSGFDTYKYNCIDTSPLSKYVMQPFWNAIVKLYPMWLAPNLITFVGFLCLIFNFLLFSYYDYSFYGYCFNRDDCLDENAYNLSQRAAYFQGHLSEYSKVPGDLCSCIPRWLWLVLSVCQFLSHHLDGTDGKQARRTGSSSPLGELFDHGLDSWATLFLPVALVSIFGRSEVYGITVYSMYGILWLIMLSFIVSHWEKYNTGVLYLPWSYDLSQIGMTFLFFVTWLFGQDIWYFKLDFIGLPDLTITRTIEIFIYVVSISLSVPVSIYNMYIAYTEKTLKQKSIYEGIRPLLSTIYLFVLQYIWLKYSKANIMELEPRAFFWLTGTLFSNISCRLIIAQMTSTRCEIFNWVLIPLTFAVTLFTYPGWNAQTNKFLTREVEIYSLYLLALIATLSHIHYGICNVRQICKHLNIYCFVITSKPTKKDS